MNFWSGVEKVSKNEKLSKIHENVFEHIPNAHALQFWAPNSPYATFGHDFRAGPRDFGGFSSKVDFLQAGLHIHWLATVSDISNNILF